MDDVGRSSMRSAGAGAGAAPVAAPLLSRCHSVPLQCHQQLDEQEEPAKPASQQEEEEKKRQSVIEMFGLVWFGFV